MKLLVEEPGHPMIMQRNDVFARALSKAKGYIPVYLKRQSRPWHKRAYIIFLACYHYLKLKDVLDFKYEGVKYGDTLYDSFLALYGLATIKKKNYRLIRTIHSIIFRHKEVKNTLVNDDYAAVLVSQQVGVDGGVLTRVALNLNIPVYLANYAIELLASPKDIYNDGLRPTVKEIEQIIEILGDNFKTVFKEVVEKQITGKGPYDMLFAYSDEKKLYTNREEFLKDFNLEDKKNVFIMLHAFNDYPHIYGPLIFRDYYEWFYETLQFARNNKSVNWIFKQHPANHYYVAKDVNYKALFADLPDNVKFIDTDKQIDTRSLEVCADLVVTCLGSAGFELPAIAGIPSLIGGNTFYSGLGFTREPKNKSEYFADLWNVGGIDKLNNRQQTYAQAAYIYIYYLSALGTESFPKLTNHESHNFDEEKFWEKVYAVSLKVRTQEFDYFVEKLKDPNFRKINHLDQLEEMYARK